MRQIGAWLSAAWLLAAWAAGAAAAEPDVQALIREFKGESPARTRSAQELDAAYASVLQTLLPDMASDDLGRRGSSHTALEMIAHTAGRPGAEVQRLAFAKAAATRLGPDVPTIARLWILRQLQHVGKAEVVPAVAALLEDKDPHVRESARRSLQYNSAPEATAALAAALEKAASPDWTVALTNALADRRDPATAPALVRRLADKDPAVALAAIEGLGRIGGPEAARALAAARATVPARLRPWLLDAWLRCADQFVAEGRKDEAAAIYNQVNAPAETKAVRIAALRGLMMARGQMAMPLLKDLLASPDAEMQAIAASLANEVPGPEVTRALAALVPQLPLSAQAVVVAALGVRADPAGKPAVLEALASDDDAVRTSAVQAMATLGDASDVPRLAQLAGRQGERGGAAETLVRLSAPGVDDALVKALDGADAGVRAPLVRILAARNAASAVPAFLRAAADADPAVSREALKALGGLADEKALPAVVGLLVKAAADDVRQAAEMAVGQIAGRAPAREACAEPVLAALGGAAPPARQTLLRLLGRLGGAKALAAVRAALKDPAPELQDAALRALADWPDGSPADDLLTIARADPSATRQVLALRGYVRMAGLGRRPAAERTRMYQAAFAAARRPEEKKMVLAGAADAPSPEGLALAQAHLADADLKAEAAVAVVRIAAAVGGTDRDAAKAALRQVIQTPPNDAVRQQAQDALAAVEKHEDFLMAWMVCGPYTQRDKDGPALFDLPLGPEKDPAAPWKPLALDPADSPAPGVLNLLKVPAGDNSVVYLRCALWSDKAQDALLELGSDDGIKAWLNGKVVHANNTTRAISPGSDKVKVRLTAGWNTLMLKVTQGGGDFAACARVRAPDGSRLDGLRVRPEPEK